ncbi:MAG: hypothetical protein JWN03_4249 [Nocardia sp.]|nr:hypothetical protein [Nocardia sp.]
MNDLHAMLHTLIVWLHQQGILPATMDMMDMQLM